MVKPLGRVPKFRSQRCRQRAAEKRKWLRAPPAALAADIGTAAAIRDEAWLLLKQMRVIPDTPKRAPPRPPAQVETRFGRTGVMASD